MDFIDLQVPDDYDPEDPKYLKPGEKRVECQACHGNFTARRADAKWCSKSCRQWAWRQLNEIATLTVNLDHGTKLALDAIAGEHNVSSQQLAAAVLRSFIEQEQQERDVMDEAMRIFMSKDDA